MTTPPPTDSDYTVIGYSEEMLHALMRHNAEDHAAHLTPHLKPGMRVLDFGCGPGSLSTGLARAVAPGELYGIDIEQSQVYIANALAAYLQQSNTVFQVGDAADMPFEDGFFDVAHCHDVLMHIPDTQAVLAEVKRVLKPGGIIACREMIVSSSFTYPDYGVLARAWDLFEDLLATDGGHPQMGKDLKNQLGRAGFDDAQITASFELISTPEELDFIYVLASDWFLSREMKETALQYGASTKELFESIQASYEQWKDDPGAICALAFGEAVAYKPQA